MKFKKLIVLCSSGSIWSNLETDKQKRYEKPRLAASQQKCPTRQSTRSRCVENTEKQMRKGTELQNVAES